jgi:hypothetical protein
MVYLWIMVIFHSYVTNNQMVMDNEKNGLMWIICDFYGGYLWSILTDGYRGYPEYVWYPMGDGGGTPASPCRRPWLIHLNHEYPINMTISWGINPYKPYIYIILYPRWPGFLRAVFFWVDHFSESNWIHQTWQWKIPIYRHHIFFPLITKTSDVQLPCLITRGHCICWFQICVQPMC